MHTLPLQIGNAKREDCEERAARKTAEARGFNFEKRTRNGFEPWAATFISENDDGQEFQFAAYPIVRGWQRVG